MSAPSSASLAPLVDNPAQSSLFSSLISQGAKWSPPSPVGDEIVHTLSNVSYGPDSSAQSLDVYFPDDLVPPAAVNARIRPVLIHIHGGGWSRGAKESAFYGGPAMARAAAASGCLVVTPGYRLGAYPAFMFDVARAVRWALDHAGALGGDVENVFLSGHSAGAHIASLLLLRRKDFLDPLGVCRGFLRGAILVSGVYDLFRPMAVAPIDVKNKWFSLAYVAPAFGTDAKLLRESSPLLLLEPAKDISNGGTIMRGVAKKLNFMRSGSDAQERTRSPPPEIEIDVNTADLPPFLVMNASLDMGLQENGKLMAEALSSHTETKYCLFAGTNHASICWNEKSTSEIASFIAERCWKEWKRRGEKDKA